MSLITLNEDETAEVDRLVHTSVDDARNSLRLLNPDENEDGAAGLERNLRVLRAALELEKDGQARTTLVGGLRTLICANEGALESLLDGPGGRNPEPIPAPPKSGLLGKLGGLLGKPKGGTATGEGQIDLQVTVDDQIAPAFEATESDATAEEAAAASAEEAPAYGGLAHASYRLAPRSEFAHHPRLEAIPMSADVAAYLTGKKDERGDALTEDLAAFNESVAGFAIIEPIKVVPCPPLLSGEDDGVRWWVVDGRTRIQSLEADDVVPFVEIHPNDVDLVIESTITARRNWTKGQKAYLAVIRNPELLDGEQGKRTDLETSRTECGKSAREEIASRFGISQRLLEQAIEVVRAMDNLRAGYPKKVEEMEMEVWAGTGLAQVLSGLKGFGASFGKTKPKPIASAAAAGLAKLAKATKGFSEWDRAQVMAFRDEAQKFWDDLDPSVSEFLTWVKVGATSELEKIIDAHKPAEQPAEMEGGAK